LNFPFFRWVHVSIKIKTKEKEKKGRKEKVLAIQAFFSVHLILAFKLAAGNSAQQKV
jgi:hypothetical protein